ncbi:MAG: YggS family pyridoxal phosphate-dependent enzyme [Planctomycetia bacterium]|nr:YggS family pyridoxal phosphate-dependent enzyme [Planctomycetia bacterium]
MIDPQKTAANLAHIREQIASAALRSGRPAGAVTLVAVTKSVGVGEIAALLAAGCRDIGESRPQDLWQKHAALTPADPPVRWHLVGHLQRNKVRRTLPMVEWIHSADSARLLNEIESESEKLNLAPKVLLEVNVSGDATKHGFRPDEVLPLLPTLAGLVRVQVRGLMTMASLEGGPSAARRDFAALRELRDLAAPLCPPNVSLHELSMGMSGDFEIAIEEGATMVRIGSALFA